MKNFAIIGCGAAARIHAGALKEMDNGRLYGVYDNHSDRAQAFAAENQCKAFTSLEEVLSCEEVDIVNICLPSGLHGTTAASPGYPRRIEINGTKGSVVLEEDSIVRWDVEGEEEPTGQRTVDSCAEPMSLNHGYHRLQLADLIAAIDENRAPLVDVYEGKKPVEIVLAAYESSRTGKKVELV